MTTPTAPTKPSKPKKKLSPTQTDALRAIARGDGTVTGINTRAALVGRGLITPASRSWEHELTDAGRAHLAGLDASTPDRRRELRTQISDMQENGDTGTALEGKLDELEALENGTPATRPSGPPPAMSVEQAQAEYDAAVKARDEGRGRRTVRTTHMDSVRNAIVREKEEQLRGVMAYHEAAKPAPVTPPTSAAPVIESPPSAPTSQEAVLANLTGATGTAPTWRTDALRAALASASSRGAGHAAIAHLKATELKQLARDLGVPDTGRKADVADRIVERTTGARLNSQAIRTGVHNVEQPKPAPSADERVLASSVKHYEELLAQAEALDVDINTASTDGERARLERERTALDAQMSALDAQITDTRRRLKRKGKS